MASLHPIIVIIGTHGKLINNHISPEILPEFDKGDVIKINATKPGICNFLGDDTKWINEVVKTIPHQSSLWNMAKDMSTALENNDPELHTHATRSTFITGQDREDHGDWLRHNESPSYSMNDLKSGFTDKRYSLNQDDEQDDNPSNFRNKITVISPVLDEPWSLYPENWLKQRRNVLNPFYQPTTSELLQSLYDWWNRTYPEQKFQCIIIDLSCNEYEGEAFPVMVGYGIKKKKSRKNKRRKMRKKKTSRRGKNKKKMK